MAEFWKSTPKYFCKYCKTYVNDTKFGRAEHDKTDRHQNSLKRFLNELHRRTAAEQRNNPASKSSSSSSSAARAPEPPVPRLKIVPKRKLPDTLDDSHELAQFHGLPHGLDGPADPVLHGLSSEWQVVAPPPAERRGAAADEPVREQAEADELRSFRVVERTLDDTDGADAPCDGKPATAQFKKRKPRAERSKRPDTRSNE